MLIRKHKHRISPLYVYRRIVLFSLEAAIGVRRAFREVTEVWVKVGFLLGEKQNDRDEM